MDPLSALLGLSRLLVPPRAEPAETRVPRTATTDLALDGNRVRAIERTRREAGGKSIQDQQADAARPHEPGEPIEDVDLDQEQALDPQYVMEIHDPLMAQRMKAIYTDDMAISASTRALFHL